jgi:hypothetical protein
MELVLNQKMKDRAQATARLKKIKRRQLMDPFGNIFVLRCQGSDGRRIFIFALFMLLKD